MAAISGHSDVLLEPKKTSRYSPEITSLDRSCGGFGTKIHLATDGSGLPLNIVQSPGLVHESQFALRLLESMGVQRRNGRLKECRRIATRYDKTARNYLAMVKLGCIRLFYKRLCN
jgi:hypothetical protein